MTWTEKFNLLQLIDTLEAEASAGNEYDNKRAMLEARKTLIEYVEALIEAKRKRGQNRI
jgi:predicted transcriptional regulator